MTFARPKDLENKSWFDMTHEEHWSQSSLEMACQVWNLDAAQAIPHLLQLQDHLMDLKDYHLANPLELSRCYFDALANVRLAESKFRNTVAWRQQEGMDDLLDTFHAPSYVEEYYPSCYLQGYDKEGDPIWLDRIGVSDIWAVCSNFGPVPFRKYILKNREMALRGEFARQYERQMGRPPARVTVVMDMEGLGLRHLVTGLIAPLEEAIRDLQDHYGGMAKRIIVTKAPFVFRVVWSIAQHFCNESLKNAITFCNARNTQETLDFYVERDVLPPAFLPQGKGRPGIGFAQTTMEGGIMPPLRKWKTAGSNETVASCDSTEVESSFGSRTSSASTREETIPERSSVVVNATSLLTGHVEGSSNRVLLEF